MARRGENRARREARRAQATATPVQEAKASPRNRGTFAVARANAAIRDQLPDVIFQRKPREPVKAAPRKALTMLQEDAPRTASKPSKASKAAPDRSKPQLTMEKPKNCKPRPSSSKGNGTGRPFVPYCNR